MFRLLSLLILIAGVGAYFTKPDEAAHRAAAAAVLDEARDAAVGVVDLSALLNLSVASVMQEGRYEDLYVVSKYSVSVHNQPLMVCWGAFEQVRCSMEAAAAEQAARSLVPPSN
jgi:hypothetical protein